MLKAFVRDGFVYTLPTLLSRGIALLLLPLYTRVLAPGDFGSLDLLVAFGVLANLTVSLGISQGLARHFCSEQQEHERTALASTAFWFTLSCYGLFTVAALALERPLAPLVMGTEGSPAAFRIGLAYIVLNGAFYLLQNQFRWEFRSRDFAVCSALTAVITAAAAVALTWWLRMGLEGLLLGMCAGTFAGVCFAGWKLRARMLSPTLDPASLRSMLAFSLPLVPSGIVVFATQYADRLIVNHFLGTDAVGLLGIGLRFGSIAALLMVGAQAALTPLVYAHYRDPSTPGHLAHLFRLFVALGLMVSLAMAVFAQEALAVMTGPGFHGAASIVGPLVAAGLLANFYIFAPGAAIERKTTSILAINVLAAAVNVAAGIALVPAFGLSGSAAASVVSALVLFSAYMVQSQRIYPVPHRWGPILLATLGVATIGAATTMAAGSISQPLLFKLAALVAAFTLIGALGVLRASDIAEMRAMLK